MNLLSINYFFRKFSMSLFSFRKITLNLSFVPPIQYWSIIFFANLIGIDNQSRKILNSVAFPRIHFKFTLFCLFYITFRECTMNSLSFRKITFKLFNYFAFPMNQLSLPCIHFPSREITKDLYCFSWIPFLFRDLTLDSLSFSWFTMYFLSFS